MSSLVVIYVWEESVLGRGEGRGGGGVMASSIPRRRLVNEDKVSTCLQHPITNF